MKLITDLLLIGAILVLVPMLFWAAIWLLGMVGIISISSIGALIELVGEQEWPVK
jgi:hypothetical protein